MSDTFSKVEVITGVARRRRFSTELKLALVAESMQPGMSVSWKPPKTSQFWRVCDSIGQVCAGGRRCAVRLGFSMLTNG
jgi:hypothetical protein